MDIKLFEIRDRGTFIPAMAIRLRARDEADYWLLRRAGYAEMQILKLVEPSEPYIMLVKLDGADANYDPFMWNNQRTLGNAHRELIANWAGYANGDVLDVEFILGETIAPKISDRLIYAE